MSGSFLPPNWQPRTFFQGDNLEVMQGMNSGSIDLIVTDPPFNSNQAYGFFDDRWDWNDDAAKKSRAWAWENHPALGAVIESAHLVCRKSLRDTGSSMGAFLCFLAPRLVEMRRLLKPTGTLYLHCDPTSSHYIKALLDSIFGIKQYRNEIIWYYRGGGVPKYDFARRHDVIFRYAGGEDHLFFDPDPARQPYAQATIDRFSSHIGNVRDGIDYGPQTLHKIGKHPDDVITDIQPLAPSASERSYPTQKPLALLERLIATSSKVSDIVMDPFCGSGTTCLAAENLGRQWVGIDIREGAGKAFMERMTTEHHEIHLRTDLPRKEDFYD